jgi:hypothetical protein
MGAMAAILGGIGGLCAVLGVITATEVLPPLHEEFTWMFWFGLSTILLLASIALAVGGRGGSYD